jgi:hypothetical protein
MYAGERKLLCWEGNSFYDRGFPDRVVRVLKPAGRYGLWFSNPTLANGQRRRAIVTAGLNLRASRERLGLTMREVESASVRIAEKHGNDEFAISPSRLSDIETKGLVPSIYRLYSLAVIYRHDLREIL